MSNLKPRSNFWKSIAYDQYSLPTAPGYALKFFGSFEEFDQYIRENIDQDWMNTPWGKYLLQTEDELPESNVSINLYQDYVESLQSRGAINNSYVTTRNNYEHLARTLIREGITDVDALMYIIGQTEYSIKEYTETKKLRYKPTRKTLARYIQRYTSKAYKQPTKQVPKYIVKALAKWYLDKKHSLRETSRLLSQNEGIQLSHERVRELAAEE